MNPFSILEDSLSMRELKAMMKGIGEALYNMRVEANMTIEEVARITELPKENIQAIERGEAPEELPPLCLEAGGGNSGMVLPGNQPVQVMILVLCYKGTGLQGAMIALTGITRNVLVDLDLLDRLEGLGEMDG